MVVSLIISALVIGSVYGLIALGYSLIYSASGLMTFTQGELLMLGAYLGLTFYKFLGFPFIVALILTLIIMFVFGLMIERFLIRVLLNKKASPIYVVLSTIALSIVLMNMAQQIWGSLTLQFPSIFSVVTVDVLGSAIQPESFLVMIVGLISMVTMHNKDEIWNLYEGCGHESASRIMRWHKCGKDNGHNMGHGGSSGGIGRNPSGPCPGCQPWYGDHDWIEGICGSSHRRLWKHVRSYPGRTDHRLLRNLYSRLYHFQLQRFYCFLPAYPGYDFHAQRNLQGKGL